MKSLDCHQTFLCLKTRVKKDNCRSERGITPDFFVYQNTPFKLFIVIIGLVISLYARWQYTVAIYLITILWLTADVKVLLEYGKGLLLTLPFFSSYLLLGLIFNLSLNKQMILVFRICLLLLYSVFLFKTIDVMRLVKETGKIRKCGLINSLFFFFIATAFFSKLFFNELKTSPVRIKRAEDVISVIVTAFNNVSSQFERIEKRVDRILILNEENKEISSVNTTPAFTNWANVYLTFLLMLYTLVLAL